MKRKLLIFGLVLAILFGIEYKDRAEARTTIGLNVFFDALEPYGDWVSAPDYGYVWHPRGVERGWRPYSDGQWLWSDYGWLWSSHEPWGWATYHYGRWVFDNYYGWVWMPGTVWAPAWVTWYTSPGYIGWAPLPPDDYFFSGIGIGFNYNNYDDDYYHDRYHGRRHRRSYIDPSHCVFVPSHNFLKHRINSVAIASSRNITIINNTKNITNIKVVNNNVVNYGPDVRVLEKETRAKIRKINVVESGLTVTRGAAKVNQLEGDKYYAFRPRVVKKGNEAPILRGNIKKDSVGVENKKVDLGVPAYEKTTRKNEPFIPKNKFDDSSTRAYGIDKLNKKGNLIRSKNEEIKIPNENVFEEFPNRENSIKLENKRRGNSLVKENAFQPQVRHTYSEDKYPARQSLKKESLLDSSDLKQPKKANSGSYLSPRTNKDLGHRKEISTGNERIYRQGSTNLRKNVKSDVQKYQSNRGAVNYQSMFKNVPKNSTNPRNRF